MEFRYKYSSYPQKIVRLNCNWTIVQKFEASVDFMFGKETIVIFRLSLGLNNIILSVRK